MLIRVSGSEMNPHPNAALMNVFTDCPHCGCEEWFQVFRDQRQTIVHCQNNAASNPRYDYILEYESKQTVEQCAARVENKHNMLDNGHGIPCNNPRPCPEHDK